jgi:N-acetylglucosamine-6-sulfatase
MTRNGEVPVSYEGKYSTDVIKNKTLDFLDDAMSHDAPWFVVAAPVACHSNLIENYDTGEKFFRAPRWAKRHNGLFADAQVDRDDSFNTLTDGAAGWHKTLKPLNDTVLAYNDHYYVARLRALQAVDEMVEEFIQKVEAAGQLDNTYIVYTTDNGFHISQHAMSPGKECGYGEQFMFA